MLINDKIAIKIAVCDDKSADLEATASLCRQVLDSSDILYHTELFHSGNQLIDAVAKGNSYDIILLDMVMEDRDGMETARAIRSLDEDAMIIFVSRNTELALLGYEVSAVRYLAKPLDEIKLTEALLTCCSRIFGTKNILVPTDQGKYRIALADIQFIEASERGTRFTLTNESFHSRLKLNEAAAMLHHSTFILCHRAYIVNLSHVRHLHRYEFRLKSGAVVPVSKGRYNDIRGRFTDYKI